MRFPSTWGDSASNLPSGVIEISDGFIIGELKGFNNDTNTRHY